jgi:hypothetical protein
MRIRIRNPDHQNERYDNMIVYLIPIYFVTNFTLMVRTSLSVTTARKFTWIRGLIPGIRTNESGYDSFLQ